MIRLIASDLDGTLLSPDGQLSDRSLAAIAAATAAGIEVIAATGRSFRTAHQRLRPAGELRTMVCSNGALVYDLPENAIGQTRPIPGDLMREAFAQLRLLIPLLRFGWETAEGFGLEPDFGQKPGDSEADESLLAGPQHVADVDFAIKIFIAHPQVERLDLQRLVVPALPAFLNGSTSGARFVEVTAAGVDKGSTVAGLAAEWGIASHEVLAIGDEMNDESLLRWAGVAVAMGNGRPEVKDIADVVADSCAADGAAKIMEAAAAGQF